MLWFFRLVYWVPLILTSIILLWLFYLELKSGVLAKTVGRALGLLILIYLLQIVAQSIYLYFRLKGDELGQYLLPPQSNYFYQAIWTMSASSVWAIAIGVVLILVILILGRIFKSRLIDLADLIILFLCVFVVGAANVLVLILASFFLMIFFLIGFGLRQKKINTRAKLTLSPFLLMTAFIILILNNFDFYFNFLKVLRLT